MLRITTEDKGDGLSRTKISFYHLPSDTVINADTLEDLLGQVSQKFKEPCVRGSVLEDIIGELFTQVEGLRARLELRSLFSSPPSPETVSPLALRILDREPIYRVLGFLNPKESAEYLGISIAELILTLEEKGIIAKDRKPLKYHELMCAQPRYDKEGIRWYAYHPELLDILADSLDTPEYDL